VIPAWMENVEAWDLAARRGACQRRTQNIVVCDVDAQWQTLQMEMTQRWTFTFEGQQVDSIVIRRQDRDPADRLEPLRYRDLDAWEAWLVETHPHQTTAFLARNALIASFLRYDPTQARQIGRSIREYLAVLAKDPDRDIRDQTTVIDRLVDAIEARDTDAFVAVFTPGAAFNPRGDFREGISVFGNTQPIAQAALVEAWMAINHGWGFIAEVIGCHPDTDTRGSYADDTDWVILCEVTSRWHALSLEITEQWTFEFQGNRLTWWGPGPLDLNPTGRSLPVGYDGLEAWEAWLATNHPENAARYLNPRQLPGDCDGCQEWQKSLAPGDPERAARLASLLWEARDDWKINGHGFWPDGLIPYDPAFADQIESSIQHYLKTVRPALLPGTR
jgi:hypothetical protein